MRFCAYSESTDTDGPLADQFLTESVDVLVPKQYECVKLPHCTPIQTLFICLIFKYGPVLIFMTMHDNTIVQLKSMGTKQSASH